MNVVLMGSSFKASQYRDVRIDGQTVGRLRIVGRSGNSSTYTFRPNANGRKMGLEAIHQAPTIREARVGVWRMAKQQEGEASGA